MKNRIYEIFVVCDTEGKPIQIEDSRNEFDSELDAVTYLLQFAGINDYTIKKIFCVQHDY